MTEALIINLNNYTPGPAQFVMPGDYLFQIRKGGKQIANADGVRSQARWVVEIVAGMPGLESEVGKIMFHNTNTTPAHINITMSFLSVFVTPEEFKGMTSKKTLNLTFDAFVGKFFGGSVADVAGQTRNGEARTFSNITRIYSKDIFQKKYDEAQKAPVSIFSAVSDGAAIFDGDDEEV